MAANEEDGDPYVWDDGPQPSPEVMQLWVEVGNGLEKNQTGTTTIIVMLRCEFSGI